jgi:Raf kinase inhibitor-like YbhB/YbcL family protein
MKKVAFIFIVIIILGLAAFILYRFAGKTTKTFISRDQNTINTIAPMIISSPAFLDSQTIPKQYTCDGDGINPALQLADVPAEAKSLALIISDPDAPSPPWIHWVMWNISASTTEISENSVPQGAIQGKGSSGQNVYGSPCPPVPSEAEGPSGTHHYIFTVYALDSTLNLPSYSTADKLQAAMQGHIITQAQLVGVYGR